MSSTVVPLEEQAPPSRLRDVSGEAAHGRVAAEVDADAPPSRIPTKPNWATIGTFLILLMSAIYYAQDVIVPCILAFFLALVLSPVVRFGTRRRVPAGATAGLLVVGAAALVAGGAYMISGPVADLVTSGPRIVADLEEKLAAIREPVEEALNVGEDVAAASGAVEETAGGDPPQVQEVVVKEPGLLTSAAYGAPEVLAKVILSLVLLFFLLASGDLFYEKLVRVIPKFKDKKRAIKIAYTVERTLSRYLLTITLINAGLGVVVATVMWLLGMPNPVVWGVIAFALNFIPYVGAILGIAFAGVVAFVTFDDASYAVIIPLAYLACTTLEGQLITPAVVGQRLSMNAVAIFLGVAFWGWMWGAVGMLIAVPMMVALKILADNIPGLSGLAEFLSGRHTPGEDNAEETVRQAEEDVAENPRAMI